MNGTDVNNSTYNLAQEARELYLPKEIKIIDQSLTALNFLRDYVSKNIPVIIKGGCKCWPAFSKWSYQYLRSRMSNKEVTVAVTPTGYADAVFNGKFILPEERKLPFDHILNYLESDSKSTCFPTESDAQENLKMEMETNYKSDFYDISCNNLCEYRNFSREIFYVQKQNSNLTDEFSELIQDVPLSISWADEAIGILPDAVNFWIGDEKATTSLHKDHYENLYCVIKGKKYFTLYPPTDQLYIPYESYKVGQFRKNENCTHFNIVDMAELNEVKWCPVDPDSPDLINYPNFSKAVPLKVEVSEGDILYLPSLWFHHVKQSHMCVAVNYWYDMQYDIKYNYFKFVESLIK